jgi:hypothetical protein
VLRLALTLALALQLMPMLKQRLLLKRAPALRQVPMLKRAAASARCRWWSVSFRKGFALDHCR